MAESISKKEFDERVAVLKRFRSLLEQQRAKFQEYLVVLEKQQEGIEAENTEALTKHTELEQQIVSNISTLQRVIKPMESLYIAHGAFLTDGLEEEREIPKLKTDLEKLQKQVLAQNEKNRKLLTARMSQVRSRIEGFRNPYRNTRSVYASDSQTASIIQIQA